MGPFVRSPAERNYGYAMTTPHLDESVNLFERTTEAMLVIAAYESKLTVLGREAHFRLKRFKILRD